MNFRVGVRNIRGWKEGTWKGCGEGEIEGGR